MSLLTLKGLVERPRAPSQSQKGHFSEKTKLKKWHQNSWHWQKSAQSSEIFVTSRGICRGVGVSLRKGEHFPFWSKMVRTKIKPDIDGGILSSCILDGLSVHVSKLGQKGPSGAPSGPRRVQLEQKSNKIFSAPLFCFPRRFVSFCFVSNRSFCDLNVF